MNFFIAFYAKLFGSSVTDKSLQREIISYTDSDDSHEADHGDLDHLFFNVDNLKHCLSDVENNKTPGPDGIPSEFYKTFFPEL